MPRPDRGSEAGSDDGPIDEPIVEPVAATRVRSWTKYGGPETVGGHRGSSSAVEVTVDDITIVERADEAESKYTTRGTSAHGVGTPDVGRRVGVEPPMTEWRVIRTIDDRTYRRVDTLVTVSASLSPAD